MPKKYIASQVYRIKKGTAPIYLVGLFNKNNYTQRGPQYYHPGASRYCSVLLGTGANPPFVIC